MNTRTARIDLEHDSNAPRTARRFLVRVLRGWGVSPETIERSQLLVSELVSNAVLHGAGPVQLRARELDTAPGAIRIEVCNGGRGRPRMRRAAQEDLSGRGLQIVDELSGGWGSRNFDDETVVWFELRSSLA
jgi:anti-sigma regulatory factor (Ser/Thr protein kinase)